MQSSKPLGEYATNRPTSGLLTNWNDHRWIPYIVSVQAFRSKTMAIAIQTLICVMALFITIAVQETSSRLAWSFARDGGIILSNYMQRTHPKLEVPHFALAFTYGLVAICGLIYLASATGMLSYKHRQTITEN